jgi:hypothetical protein
MQKRLGMLKKLKNILMWEGECLHWGIARFIGAVRDNHSVSSERVTNELKGKIQREWLFSEQKRFLTQPALIDKGGLGLVEHAYDSVPNGVNSDVVYEKVARGFQTFAAWAEGAAAICEKVRTADNVWIEPPVFGADAPGFHLDGVQILTKVDLAIEKSGDFFEIYDWKSGKAPVQNGTNISQNELQVCVYQLWPHLSMSLPLALVSSNLVYLGAETPAVQTHRLDERSVPMVLLMIRNSTTLADRWAKNFERGLLRLEDLDYAGWAGHCRECGFKAVCRESLQNENVA